MTTRDAGRSLGPLVVRYLLRLGGATVLELTDQLRLRRRRDPAMQDAGLPGRIREWLFDHDYLVWCDSTDRWQLRDDVAAWVRAKLAQEGATP